MQAGGSLILSTRLTNGMTTSTGQPVPWWFYFYLWKESPRAEEFRILTMNKSVTADGSLPSPTGGVKGMYPATDIHEHFTIHNYGYGKLCTSSRTTSTTLCTLRTIA